MEDGMRALALTETRDHVCGRYRIHAFRPALEACGWTLEVQAIEKGLLGRRRQFDRAGEFDAVLLQRKLLPAWQLGQLRRRARFLLFDFDDAILYRDSYDPRGPHCPRRAARFRGVMQMADAVVAGNDFLADCALRSGARADAVRVIPTCIDLGLYPPRNAEREGYGPGIDLAWIGSSSTLAGIESRRATWDRVGAEVSGSRLRLICDRTADLGALPVVTVPWSSATEAAELGAADVGVSWVPDDLWSQGKCGLKVLQSMAAGLPAVANPVGVHPEMIRAGETGLLAETADEWVEAIRSLRDDPEGRLAMGRAARLSVEAGYSVSAWAPTFVGAVSGRARPPAPKYRQIPTDARALRPPVAPPFGARPPGP